MGLSVVAFARSIAAVRPGSTARSLAVVLTIALAGCATQPRLPAVPTRETAEATFLGIPDARFSLTGNPSELTRIFVAAERRAQMSGMRGTEHMLAISGGGEDGAFGAGLLFGWTERGDRPQFRLVTGVSTGSLSAPFAFLGSRYDAQLKAVYTTVQRTDIVEILPVLTILRSDSVGDSGPLARLIATHVTDEMVAEIGREYQKGRMLLIGTTNLDLGQPIAWNIGAIAVSNHPRKVQAIRDILLASASIPGAFPPVMMEVMAGGTRRQEMHVDGGATTQVFLYPGSIPLRHAPAAVRRVPRVAWIIRNGRTQPLPEDVKRGLLQIAARSISTMITSNAIGDIYRMYLITRRDGVDFNLAYISSRFTVPYEKPFDPPYMNALFEFGRSESQAGSPWLKRPPGYVP
ncbi:MAG: patatin-like phospholipase family protein [Phreatobacter sp.]|uniref:patatin-like phospholipase family protein n=1 Tax=Phreatobacter sp. TaxID=1966341 RepID=UPI001A5B3E36|nr:patatin-like phospholipase family protein [Phreatobacter sp.]MBL8568544.1 patatin-like phospholipase family protein [Phreatobacter sp.]